MALESKQTDRTPHMPRERRHRTASGLPAGLPEREVRQVKHLACAIMALRETCGVVLTMEQQLFVARAAMNPDQLWTFRDCVAPGAHLQVGGGIFTIIGDDDQPHPRNDRLQVRIGELFAS